jgi:DNA-binding transcriptional ArsR family regulator
MRHRSVTYSRDAAFNALADPTRRAVLDLLRAGIRPAGDIARAFPISRPAISKHLKILRRAHLVAEHRQGRNRLYQLNPEPLKTVDEWLDEYRRFWTASLENLKSFVESEYQKEMSSSSVSETKTHDPKPYSRRKDS